MTNLLKKGWRCNTFTRIFSPFVIKTAIYTLKWVGRQSFHKILFKHHLGKRIILNRLFYECVFWLTYDNIDHNQRLVKRQAVKSPKGLNVAKKERGSATS